jgi:hypothetical protein
MVNKSGFVKLQSLDSSTLGTVAWNGETIEHLSLSSDLQYYIAQHKISTPSSSSNMGVYVYCIGPGNRVIGFFPKHAGE